MLYQATHDRDRRFQGGPLVVVEMVECLLENLQSPPPEGGDTPLPGGGEIQLGGAAVVGVGAPLDQAGAAEVCDEGADGVGRRDEDPGGLADANPGPTVDEHHELDFGGREGRIAQAGANDPPCGAPEGTDRVGKVGYRGRGRGWHLTHDTSVAELSCNAVTSVPAAPSPSVVSLLGIGVTAGLFSGILGVGGGIVMVPLMVGALAFDQHRAHATSLAAIVLIALSAVLGFGSAGEVELLLGLTIGLSGIIGATLGANVMHRLSASSLTVVFGGVMVLAGARMVLGGSPAPGQAPGTGSMVVAGVLIGLVAGFASGVAGIGGGVIMVPAMVLLGFGQHSAEGTSLLAILFTAVAGTRVNLRHRRVDLKQAVVIGMGGVVSAQAGVWIALMLPADRLARLFGVFVAALGARMVVGVYRHRSRDLPHP